MCLVTKPKQSAATAAATTPPQVIDGTGAADEEMKLRRQRAGIAATFKTAGGRMGDVSTPTVATKVLFGQ